MSSQELIATAKTLFAGDKSLSKLPRSCGNGNWIAGCIFEGLTP